MCDSYATLTKCWIQFDTLVAVLKYRNKGEFAECMLFITFKTEAHKLKIVRLVVQKKSLYIVSTFRARRTSANFW